MVDMLPLSSSASFVDRRCSASGLAFSAMVFGSLASCIVASGSSALSQRPKPRKERRRKNRSLPPLPEKIEDAIPRRPEVPRHSHQVPPRRAREQEGTPQDENIPFIQ